MRQLLAEGERLAGVPERLRELGAEPEPLLGHRELRENAERIGGTVELDVGLHQLVLTAGKGLGPGQGAQPLGEVRELRRGRLHRGEGQELARGLHRRGVLGSGLRPGGPGRLGPADGQREVTGLDS